MVWIVIGDFVMRPECSYLYRQVLYGHLVQWIADIAGTRYGVLPCLVFSLSFLCPVLPTVSQYVNYYTVCLLHCHNIAHITQFTIWNWNLFHHYSAAVMRLLLGRPGFVSRPVIVGFVVDEVTLGRILLRVRQFPLSVSFDQCSTPICYRCCIIWVNDSVI